MRLVPEFTLLEVGCNSGLTEGYSDADGQVVG
jgi:hypothetical protein